MQGSDQRDTAVQYFRQAYALQMQGEYQKAIELYTRSIEAYPTAEAYTFRGWSYSFLGDYNQAITECLHAIKVDPDFGNPYNDIGAYLIEQGKLTESIAWLEKAIDAVRYESYCFPWFNLGRVYEKRFDWEKARGCYRRALQENPDYQVAKVALKKLRVIWN
jgi:tetratricopeptide (TPR) repeat protein